MVEEVVEVLAQRVPDEDDVIPERNLVLSQIFPDLVLHHALPMLDVLQTLLDLLLQRRLEVQFIDRVQGHYRVQQMVRVQALCADLLLTLEAEENEVLVMERAHILMIEVRRQAIVVAIVIVPTRRLRFDRALFFLCLRIVLLLAGLGPLMASQILSLCNVRHFGTVHDVFREPQVNIV